LNNVCIQVESCLIVDQNFSHFYLTFIPQKKEAVSVV
jgi:hypothetical protein